MNGKAKEDTRESVGRMTLMKEKFEAKVRVKCFLNNNRILLL